MNIKKDFFLSLFLLVAAGKLHAIYCGDGFDDNFGHLVKKSQGNINAKVYALNQVEKSTLLALLRRADPNIIGGIHWSDKPFAHRRNKKRSS